MKWLDILRVLVAALAGALAAATPPGQRVAAEVFGGPAAAAELAAPALQADVPRHFA